MRIQFTIMALFISFLSYCQDSIQRKDQWNISGYIKELPWIEFDGRFNNANTSNLLHNRINLKWKPSGHINGRLEIRNRFYAGDAVYRKPGFEEQLSAPDEAIQLSTTFLKSRSTILHSNIERAWIEYRQTKWNLRAGRQRINWGICNIWNPNDIFNSYSFLDFDYEERAGTDAARLQYLPASGGNIELAAAATNGKPILAAKYASNFEKYDWQVMAGSYKNIFTTGLGWAGSLGETGFKGELQFFAGKDPAFSHLLFSLEADHMLKNGWYLLASVLYNQKGLNRPVENETMISYQPSPRNLMPARWNLLVSSSKEFTPRFNGSLSVVYSPEVKMLVLFPSFGYDMGKDLDLSLVTQSFFAETNRFRALSHIAFLRLKWSF